MCKDLIADTTLQEHNGQWNDSMRQPKGHLKENEGITMIALSNFTQGILNLPNVFNNETFWVELISITKYKFNKKINHKDKDNETDTGGKIN